MRPLSCSGGRLALSGLKTKQTKSVPPPWVEGNPCCEVRLRPPTFPRAEHAWLTPCTQTQVTDTFRGKGSEDCCSGTVLGQIRTSCWPELMFKMFPLKAKIHRHTLGTLQNTDEPIHLFQPTRVPWGFLLLSWIFVYIYI